MDIRWKHPFTMIIAGPSSSGKSFWVQRFLTHAHELCDTAFDRILLYYAEWQECYRKLSVPGRKTEFREGLPQPGDYSHDSSKKKLIIIDDLMRESSNNAVLDLFTRGSHHKNISVIFITQNLFHKGSGQRDISLNSHYIVLFKNPRDRAQIVHLARQVYPEDSSFLRQAYFDATVRPHGYLLLDLKQTTPDEFRFRTNVFPSDTLPQYAYVPKYSQRLT